MSKASYDDWLKAVKDQCRAKSVDYDDLADSYGLQDAYAYGMKPDEVVADAVKIGYGVAA